MAANYSIAHPENCCMLKLFLSLLLPRPFRPQFIECPEAVRLHVMDNWKVKVSLILMRIAKRAAVLLATLGICVEFFLNLFSVNGGVLRTLLKLINGRIIIPKRGSDSFLSFVGHVVERSDLYNEGPQEDLNGFLLDPGNRFFADISIMASTLVYENECVIRKRVNEEWQMHFVGFFDFWNDHLGKKSTQAFIFCDKETDANLVVISFRGTQIFEADDYITDLDFSWYRSNQMGKVHLGFLEALGLVNRSNIENSSDDSSSEPPLDTIQDPKKPLAYYVLRHKLEDLLEVHRNAKFIVTGHSLGGALAVLFSATLFVHKKEKLLEKLFAVYTFGQPRVGDEAFKDFMDTSLNVNQPVPRYFRIVYSNDIVPRIPFDDPVFMFKHFGVCLYYTSTYAQKRQNLAEEPNRNFSVRFFIPMTINAMWELVLSLVLGHVKEFRESRLSTVCRIIGISVPGLISHIPLNYINAVRLGPPTLNPTLSMKNY
uniref:Fungal lipase-type domain-containing protein n=1 Tax=Araucaria cunninghamii TaxID=56994 RepID=A0A0D6QUS9_ARACU